jgi:hypothetical protein
MVLVVSITVAIIFFLESFFDDYNMLRAAIHTWQMAAGNVMKLSACKFFDAYNVPVRVHGYTYSSLSTPGPYCICCLAIAACVQFVSWIVDSCSSDRKKHREAKAMQIFIALRAILFFVSTMPAVVVWCWWQSESSQLQHNPGSFIYIAKANEVLQPMGPVLAPLLLLVVRLSYFYTNCKRTIQDVEDEELQTLLEPTENTITDVSEEMELEVSKLSSPQRFHTVELYIGMNFQKIIHQQITSACIPPSIRPYIHVHTHTHTYTQVGKKLLRCA